MLNTQLSVDMPHTNYVLVDSQQKFEQLLQSVSRTDRMSFDYETSAIHNANYLTLNKRTMPVVDYPRSTITSASFRTSDGVCYYLSVDHARSFNFPKEAVLEVLLAKPKTAPLSAQNMAFEWIITKNNLDLDLRDTGPLRDSMMAAKVLDSNQRVGLKELVLRELNIIQQSYEEVTKGRRMNELTASEAFIYGCDDSEYQWQLDEIFEKRLENEGLMSYYTDLEMPIIPIVASMTLKGAYTTPELIQQKTDFHQGKMAEYEGKIFDLAGTELNLGSPQQLSKLLYGKFKIPPPPYADSKTMTDKESLYWNLNEHPIMPLIIEYKKYATRYKLYDKPYSGLLHSDTGMLHSALKPIADTSRFTSSGPNLQQLAKRGDGIEVRELFIPPPEYDYVMAWDMSQVELVLAGHRSRSKVLMAAYDVIRGDIHTTTCCNMFEITPEIALANKTYRTAGKTANFSLLYGGKARRIYRLIKLELAKMGLPMPFSLRDVELMIYRYFQQYPEILAMQKADKEYAREHGYVKSLFGRKFHLPDIHSRISWQRSKQERKATNSPIQGTCAELIKMAIIKIDNERIPVEDARMWTSIHDENVFYVKHKAARDVAAIVHKHMRWTPDGLRCQMESEGTIGRSFGTQVDMNADYSFDLGEEK